MTLASELIARSTCSAASASATASLRGGGEMTIGVVACGYADGYPRHAPTGTPVLVNGQRTRTVGRSRWT
jgi:alanine racemase